MPKGGIFMSIGLLKPGRLLVCSFLVSFFFFSGYSSAPTFAAESTEKKDSSDTKDSFQYFQILKPGRLLVCSFLVSFFFFSGYSSAPTFAAESTEKKDSSDTKDSFQYF